MYPLERNLKYTADDFGVKKDNNKKEKQEGHVALVEGHVALDRSTGGHVFHFRYFCRKKQNNLTIFAKAF